MPSNATNTNAVCGFADVLLFSNPVFSEDTLARYRDEVWGFPKLQMGDVEDWKGIHYRGYKKLNDR